MIERAPAKTNLWLQVLGKREDGFHEIRTRMVPLSLADQLTLEWTGEDRIDFTCSDPALPTGEENLVVRAVRAMEQRMTRRFGIRIHLEKRIPVGAGLGGGSSDAAAVLRAINRMGRFDLSREELAELAATLGSDVPFFVYESACDIGGRGEEVTVLEESVVPRLPIALIKPGFAISAGWAYRSLAGAREYRLPPNVAQVCPWGRMENDLETPVLVKFPLLADMKAWLLQQAEVRAALLSGSGSTMLAILRHFDEGEPLLKRAREEFGAETWTFAGTTGWGERSGDA